MIKPTETFDHIIVGGGASGCVIMAGNINAPAMMLADPCADMMIGKF